MTSKYARPDFGQSSNAVRLWHFIIDRAEQLSNAEPPKVGFRKDIEGLRAVAVVAILLFHLGTSGWSGGFVGVDIFFVISGFLIGGMTIRECRAGRFSIADFYQRRLRRIIPAFFTVLTATIIAALLLFLPHDLVNLARSLWASLAFSANIYFWATTDYFSDDAFATPLLHLWSLGVEEQFYLLFPLIALAVFRLGRWALWPMLAALTLASAYLSVTWTQSMPQAAFFLLPARAWELLMGAFVAITPLPLLRIRLLREAVAIVGLLLIIYAIATFHEYTPFPGWRAAIPCAGTAAIILAGGYGRTLVGDSLGLGLPRLVGKLSYSLYLWHWPVIVFLLMCLPAVGLSSQMQLLAGALSVALALLSWRFVEEPFRKSKAPLRTIVGHAALVSVALGALAALCIWTSGLPTRLPAQARQLAAALDYQQDIALRAGQCFLIKDGQQFDAPQCLATKPGQPRVVLLGDSHAAQLWPGLHATFPRSAIHQITASGCRPLSEQTANISDRCRRLIGWFFTHYQRTNPPDLLILAGFWKADDMLGLDRTLRDMMSRGQRVLVIGPAPAWTLKVPRLLALGSIRKDDALVDRFLMHDRWLIDTRMDLIARAHGAHFASMLRKRCAPKCRHIDENGNSITIDDAHISPDESIRFAASLSDPALVR